jgi:hypothetical protein
VAKGATPVATVVAPFAGLYVVRLGVEEGHVETCSPVAEMVRGNATLLCECKVCAPCSLDLGDHERLVPPLAVDPRSPNETESL